MAKKKAKSRKRTPARLPICPAPIANILQRLLRTTRDVTQAERKKVYDFIAATQN